MKILIVSATQQEILPLYEFLKKDTVKYAANEFKINDIYIKLLVTGPGMVNTCFVMSRELVITNYDVLINVGIAGSFGEVPLGSLFSIVADRFGDFGAEDHDGRLIDIFEMGLVHHNAFPYQNGWIKLPALSGHKSLPTAVSITVQKVTGTRQSIDEMVQSFQPNLESMEGAAFAYVAAHHSCTAYQVRSVSNRVEPRNKSNWDIPLAINKLNEFLIEYLQDLSQKHL